MTKTEIINAVADSTKQDKKTVADVCNAFLFEIRKTLRGGGKVQIVGFGTFKLTERQERVGRNPRTGEEIIIPAHKTVNFSPSKDIKRRLK